MDFSADLRSARQAAEEADRALQAAHAAVVSAARGYDAQRRVNPSARETDSARAAWVAALYAWASALAAQAAAHDRVLVERRGLDRAVNDHLSTPTRDVPARHLRSVR